MSEHHIENPISPSKRIDFIVIISLVIPTRERAFYLQESLQTALRIQDNRLEILVSDNASCDSTQEMIQAIDDRRLSYVNTGGRVSMRQNFEFALQQSRGDYVIFIGDDDAILPSQFRFLRCILEQRRPDALSWDRPTYGWPVNGYGNRTGSVKFQRSSVFGNVETVDCATSKQRLLACNLGEQGPKPAIYHGCVSREFLRSISGPDGECFRSSIPDVFVTYQAVLRNANAIHTSHPFTLNGYSPASTGGGHHAYKASDPRSKPARQFSEENQQDPVQDVMGAALSVPLAFFSTLETVRSLSESDLGTPDYRAWYHYVLNSARAGDDVTQQKLKTILQTHAETTGTQTELAEASRPATKVNGKIRKYSQRLGKVRAMMHRKRVTAEIDGRNNALTAAITYDHVLGSDYEGILNETATQGQCWKAALRRCREPRSMTANVPTFTRRAA